MAKQQLYAGLKACSTLLTVPPWQLHALTDNSYSPEAFPRSRHPSIIRYSTGIKNRFRIVDMIIPPNTVVPTE